MILAAARVLRLAAMAPARALTAAILLMLAAPAAADINSTVTPGVGSATGCTFSGNNLTCNKPPSTISGHLLLFCEYDSSAGTVTGPAGFTQVSQFSANQSRSTCYHKVAGGSEPASYTLSVSSAPGVNDGVIMDIVGAGPTPISGTPGGLANGASTNPFSAPAATGVAAQSLNIVCGHSKWPKTISIASAVQVVTNGQNTMSTCWSYSRSPTAATITSSTTPVYFSIGEQIAIAPLQVSTGTNIATPAILNQPAGFSANVAASTPPYSTAANPMTGNSPDGCFNPVAYGADPAGNGDSSPGLNTCSAAACLAQVPVCVPPGKFKIQTKPWLHQCATGLVPDIHGAGMGSTIFVNDLGRANSRGGGPALEIASSFVTSDGAVAGLVKPALVGTGNSWNNTAADPYVFDLNYPLASTQPFDGKTGFDVQACFSTTQNAKIEALFSVDGSATPVATGCGFAGPPLGGSDGGNPSYVCKGAFWLGIDGFTGKLYASMRTTSGWSGLMSSAGALSTNTTYCAEVSYDGSNIRLFHGLPNTNMTLDAKVAATGTVVNRPDEDALLFASSRFFHLNQPSYPWQGQLDTFRISSVARCTNDAGCTAPNAKLGCDSNTIFGENWTNVSDLPLVAPECTKANAATLGQAMMQPWMVAHDVTSGNPGNNHPIIENFTIQGGSLGIDMNVTAPQFRSVAVGTPQGAGGTIYGFIAATGNSYGITGYNLWGNGDVPAVFNSGLTWLYGLNFTCGLTCMLFGGLEVSGLSTLPAGSTKWGVILDGEPTHLGSYYTDAENGGSFPEVQISAMASPPGNSVTISDSELISEGVSPVIQDGPINNVTISDTILYAPNSGQAYLDATNTSNALNQIVFDNNSYGGASCPASTIPL